MGLFGFDLGHHKPKVRRFNYTPIYYKPEQDPEEIQRKKIKASYGLGEAPPTTDKEMLRYKMRERWGSSENSEIASKVRRKTIYLVLLLVLVIVVRFAI